MRRLRFVELLEIGPVRIAQQGFVAILLRVQFARRPFARVHTELGALHGVPVIFLINAHVIVRTIISDIDGFVSVCIGLDQARAGVLVTKVCVPVIMEPAENSCL